MTDDNLRPLVEALQRKLNNAVDRVEKLERENDHLKDRVADLESRTDLSMIPYREMTKREKIGRVRQYAYERAGDTNGKHAMDYNGVIDLFDGEPSRGHAVQLLKWAARDDGYDYEERSPGNNRLTCDASVVKNHGGFSLANTNEETQPA